jgi:zinc transport system permease protein
MSDFAAALADPGLGFLRLALAAGLLSSVAFGILGPVVVAKRIGTVAGSISHSVLGGVGLALFLTHERGWAWCTPALGALAAALVSAAVIGWVSVYGREREDTAIGAVWTLGMAAGVLFLARTRAFVDPMSYLFGNLLLVTGRDLWALAALDAALLAAVILQYRSLLAVCFDEEYARILGLNTRAFQFVLFGFVALSVVALLPMVGTVLVLAMLTLPAAIAGLFTRHLWSMMVLAAIVGAVFTAAGVALSYARDLPTGSTIVLLLGGAYLLLILLRRVLR